MLLPMMAFPFVLLGFGALVVLICKVNDRFPPLSPKPWVRHVGYVSLFAGLGVFVFYIGPALAAEVLFRAHRLAGFLFLAGYLLGGGAGAAFGLWRASERGRLK